MTPQPGNDNPEQSSSNRELLKSLGRVVRGLSALFWSLPCALIVCIQCAKMDTLREFNIVPPLLVTSWVFYGLMQLGGFHKHERIWISSLNRAKELALINVGLSPFLFWYEQQSGVHFFQIMIGLMAVNSVFLLGRLNTVLYRMSAMLPDEGLRQETQHFTSLNRHILLGILLLAAIFGYLLLRPTPIQVPYYGGTIMLNPDVLWFLVFGALLPLAMTMALLWKIKETILASVFGSGE